MADLIAKDLIKDFSSNNSIFRLIRTSSEIKSSPEADSLLASSFQAIQAYAAQGPSKQETVAYVNFCIAYDASSMEGVLDVLKDEQISDMISSLKECSKNPKAKVYVAAAINCLARKGKLDSIEYNKIVEVEDILEECSTNYDDPRTVTEVFLALHRIMKRFANTQSEEKVIKTYYKFHEDFIESNNIKDGTIYIKHTDGSFIDIGTLDFEVKEMVYNKDTKKSESKTVLKKLSNFSLKRIMGLSEYDEIKSLNYNKNGVSVNKIDDLYLKVKVAKKNDKDQIEYEDQYVNVANLDLYDSYAKNHEDLVKK